MKHAIKNLHHKIKTKTPKLKVWHLAAVFVVLFGILIFGNTDVFRGGGPTESVKVDFYLMSQCPYGTQVVDAIAPVAKELGDSVDLNFHFIADDNGDGTFSSLHGEPEILGNIAQLCAIKHEPKKYLDMIVCQNQNAGAIPGNWEACAREAGLNINAIKACYEGEEGKQLLSESIKQTEAVGATGSPTMFFDDQIYSGGRDTLSFKRAICARLENNLACSGIPVCASDADCPYKEGFIAVCENPNEETAACTYKEPVKFDQIVLTDDACTECNPASAVAATEGYFAGVTTKTVDIDSAEGKSLIAKYNIEKIPAILFSKEILQSDEYKSRAAFYDQFFTDLGDHVKLADSASGAIKFVSPEKQAEFEAAEKAKNAAAFELIDLVEGDNKPQIDFWVMSYCPYGNQAEEIIYDVYKNLGDKAIFNPRYVYYENYRGGGPSFCIDEENIYCSMHGVQEANQNVRELCVLRDNGIEAWFDFVMAMNSACNSGNADTCWTSVAAGLSLDTDAISECEKADYVELNKPSLEAGKILGATGSPAIYIEGVKYSGARDANAIQAALCNAFDTPPAECSVTLEGSEAAAPTGSC